MSCAHGPCNCDETHVTGQHGEYCSLQCQTAAEARDENCPCDHADCGGAAA